jgi:hypothetical protein
MPIVEKIDEAIDHYVVKTKLLEITSLHRTLRAKTFPDFVIALKSAREMLDTEQLFVLSFVAQMSSLCSGGCYDDGTEKQGTG